MKENEKCDLCGEIITGQTFPVYDVNFDIQDGLIQCGKCFAPSEIKHPYHCFICGTQLVEKSLGLIWCKKCKKYLIPFVDADKLQCLSIQN